MMVNESDGCSPFIMGNNCSQWVSTPPMTWGRPRKPKTHIFMATSAPPRRVASILFDASDGANLDRSLDRSSLSTALLEAVDSVSSVLTAHFFRQKAFRV